MNPLNSFYNNTHEREAVRGFMLETLATIAVERAFAGEDVTGIQEAKEAIDKMFLKLEEMFKKTVEPEPTNSR